VEGTNNQTAPNHTYPPLPEHKPSTTD